MTKLFAFKQDVKKFWERNKPVRVHRADKSPNFGVRVFEHLAVFATTQVEAGNFTRAKELVKELRSHEELFAKLNVEAHQFIDASAARKDE